MGLITPQQINLTEGVSGNTTIPTLGKTQDLIAEVDSWNEVMHLGNTFTVLDTENLSAVITQNDTTNNPAALIINNTGSGNDITLPNSSYIKNGLANFVQVTATADADGWFSIEPAATRVDLKVGADITELHINSDTVDTDIHLWGTGSGQAVFLLDANANAIAINTSVLAGFDITVSGGVYCGGDIGATANRISKGWFTNLEITNWPTVGGTSIHFFDRVTGTPNYLKPHTTGDTLHLNEAENASFYTTADFQIFRNDTPDISMWAANATPTADANINLTRSRGTIASPAAVQDNDLIGNINFSAFTSAVNINNGAEIRAEINGTVSAGVLPCDLVFFVNAGTDVATEGMRLVKNKDLELQGIFKCDQIAELTPASGVIIGNLNISGVQLGGADVHLVAATGDIQLSATSGTTQVISGTFSLASGGAVNNIVTGIGSLSTDSMLATAKAIFDDFAYLGGKIGGQTLSGGFGLNEDLDLQSTFAATKGEVRIRDGSDFVFVSSGGSGLFKVEENADAKIYLGRAMISSPTTDVMYLSHYDLGDSNTDYAIKQLASGRTAVNSKSGLPLDLAINNVPKATVTAGGDFSLVGELQCEDGILRIAETTTPTATTNYGKIYTKNDDKLYFQDGSGAEHEIAFV